MRFLYFVILVVFLVIIGAFAVINRENVPVNYVDQTFSQQSIHLPMALVIGGTYLLGMLSGWTVIGFLKRSVQEVTERRVS